MPDARTPAVAGTFYPANPAALNADLATYINNAESSAPPPKAIIVPHAGYIYSAPIAASAYKAIAQGRENFQRVVLLGPSHHVSFHGIATSSASHFLTPLGAIAIDCDAVNQLLQLKQVHQLDEAHAQEHSLEVQLPFLQTVLNDFLLIPLVVGSASAEEVAEVIEQLWGSDKTLIVVSSDLSHYQDYEHARTTDQATTRKIETLHYQNITGHDACGHHPLNGLLLAARHHHLRVTTVDLRNSGDTAGPHNKVVGYGAYLLHETVA
ncbi:MAG: AmmeMemoRadiSam system protein B [Gammaproteobacteria bacterium]|nr:AmmeMemoRadiSam system protein B [Gammaproteobacteria bacterium]